VTAAIDDENGTVFGTVVAGAGRVVVVMATVVVVVVGGATVVVVVVVDDRVVLVAPACGEPDEPRHADSMSSSDVAVAPRESRRGTARTLPSGCLPELPPGSARSRSSSR
jgi:hypothetical protein